MLRRLILPTGLAVVLAPASAQETNSTAFVQESLLGFRGNSVPFGCTTTGLFAESRTQILIPQYLLPAPGARLTGIAVQSQTSAAGSGSLVYRSLGVLASPVPVSSALRPTFQDNLPALAVLLNASNLTLHWQAGAWTTIPFGVAYVHDGRSSLVLDIQKVVTPTLDLTSRTIDNAGRSELPRMIYSHGRAGSNAHNAPAATVTTSHALSLKLLWSSPASAQTPTLRLRSDPTSNHSLPFAIGRTFTHTVEATPGATVGHLVSGSIHLRTVAFPPFVGRIWLRNPIPLGAATMPPTGELTTTLRIPNQPALIGAYLAFQSVAIDHPTAPWRVTNTADCVVH